MSEIGRMLDCDVPPVMPVLPLMSTVVFPLGVTSIQIRLEQSKALLRDHAEPGELIALVYSPAKREKDLSPEDLSRIGLAARVIRSLNMPNGNVQVTLEGLRRIGMEEIVRAEPYIEARVSCPDEPAVDPARINILASRILRLLKTISQLDHSYPPEMDNVFSMNLGDPGLFADTVASIVRFPVETKQRVIETLDIGERLNLVAEALESEVARLSVAEDVVRRTTANVEKNQREFFLRQQLTEIRRQLGEEDPQEMLVRQILDRGDTLGLPQHVRSVVYEEANRLRYLAPTSQESGVIRN